ncbi:MAG: EamA family transporter [Hymenobacter sp.]|nr:EamA family transporter [Hymenobacter sp.]
MPTVSRYPAPQLLVVLAFAAIYLIWGTTFFVALIGLETLPPYLMMTLRLLLAGVLLYGVSLLWNQGGPPASHRAWLRNAVCGILMLGLGSSSVIWSEQYLPSSLAAILVTTVPLWLALLDWPRWAGYRRDKLRLLGLALGTGGMVALFGGLPGVLGSGAPAPRYWLAVAAIVAGSFCSATGALLTRYWSVPGPPVRHAAVQVLAAGLFCALVSAGVGEWTTFSWAQVSSRSLWAMTYSSVFSSCVAYVAYVWLLQVRPPAVVGTYAYVNPVVAVGLGWLLAHEPVTGQQVLALTVILSGVGLLNRPTAT